MIRTFKAGEWGCVIPHPNPRIRLREDINSKKTFSFGHCPNDGGGSTRARIFWPFFPPCFPFYFDINIMVFDTFRSFLTVKNAEITFSDQAKNTGQFLPGA